eukprot:Em0005g1482a
MAAQVWSQVVRGPIVKEADSKADGPGLRADLGIRGALEKKKLYKKAVEDRRGTFTPFVTSVDGLLHREAEHFLKHMATSIAAKWEKSYAETCAFGRARLLLALVRASSLCLRGSRKHVNCFFDGNADRPVHHNKAIDQCTINKAIDQCTINKAIDQRTINKAIDQRTINKAIDQCTINKAIDQCTITRP